MKEDTPSRYRADHYCIDCGKGVSPHQSDLSRRKTQLSRAFGDSHNRDGYVLCRKHLDAEMTEAQSVARGWV